MAVVADTGLPTAANQNADKDERRTRYGESITFPLGLDLAGEDGELFMTTNATIGTGVAQTANTTQDTTKPFIMAVVPATATKSVRLHRLMMRPTAVSSGQTVQNIDVITSTAGSRTSAGTQYGQAASGIATAGYRNYRQSLAPASVMDANLWIGAPVTVLGTTPRLIAHFQPRVGTIPVINDEYTLLFGSFFGHNNQTDRVIVAGTTVDYFARQFGPCIIDPGCCVMVIPWAGSIGGAMSWEFELIWSER